MGDALRKELLTYERVNPGNKKQIKELSDLEKEGFGTDLGSIELPQVLRFITGNGWSWMQRLGNGSFKKTTGVIELIPLVKALRYNPFEIKRDLSNSPFTILMNSQKTAFKDPRRFAEDKDIVFHHAITMSKSERGKGYGTSLLKYALENTPNARHSNIICFIDAAIIDDKSKKLKLLPNESSYALHLAAGFLLIGVVEPPVYDYVTTYYSFMRFGSLCSYRFDETAKERVVNLIDEPKIEKTLTKIKRLTSLGYVGTDYDKKTHLMVFRKIKKPDC